MTVEEIGYYGIHYTLEFRWHRSESVETYLESVSASGFAPHHVEITVLTCLLTSW